MEKAENKYVESGRYFQDILDWEEKHPNTKYIINGKKIPLN